MMVFFIEMWECFGYYGMVVFLVFFMVDWFGFIDSYVNLIWGVFIVFVYVVLLIGGWIGDKVFGVCCMMIIGVLVLCVGYLMFVVLNDYLMYMYVLFGVIVVGNGLFKVNVVNFVCCIYEGDDVCIDSVFMIYYMVVNIGLMVLMFVMLWIKDYWGWYIVFVVCCGGMLFVIFNFMLMYCMFVYVGL